MTDQDFADRVAIVTGGGSGIGEACAVLLARRGAKVLVDFHLGAATRVADAIGARLPGRIASTCRTPRRVR